MSNHWSQVGICALFFGIIALCGPAQGEENWHQPYDKKASERENVFEFTQKPVIKYIGEDKYEIKFVVKGYCDVTISILNEKGQIVRHLGSGVLGKNAPPPYQKNSLLQKVIWNGKDDFFRYARPNAKLHAKVSLGLRPTFDKLIGWHKENLVGPYAMLAVDAQGAYTVSGGSPQLRKYDRDGNYIKTVFPPAANVSMDKLKGMRKLEYEPGKWAMHSSVSHRTFNGTVSGYGVYFNGSVCGAQQPLVHNNLLIYANVGKKGKFVTMFRVNLQDGSSDDKSYAWRKLSRNVGTGQPKKGGYFKSGEFVYARLKLAASPDKKWMYVSGLTNDTSGNSYTPSVYRMPLDSREHLGKKPFVGHDDKVGSDNQHFMSPEGIACDAKGRVYICDTRNNRIQVYSEAAKFLKTIKLEMPYLIQIHPKTQALYVVHTTRIKSKNTLRLIKLKSYEDPREVTSINLAATGKSRNPFGPVLLAMDHWSSPTRFWITKASHHLQILEEQGKEFKVIRDFQNDARKTTVAHATMTNPGGCVVASDPMREKLYVRNYERFDLKTGKFETNVRFPDCDDIAFDKRGNVHVHFNPGSNTPGICRLDPDRISSERDGAPTYTEVPYDYGKIKAPRFWPTFAGILEVKDQPGGHFFQHGIGVSMAGDIGEVACIYHIPRMEATVSNMFVNRRAGSKGGHSYADFAMRVQQMQKRGIAVATINRGPGRIIAGSTIWVFDSTGELRTENIIHSLGHTNGVGLDEDGAVYTVVASTKMVGGRAFLSSKGKIIGSGKPSGHPFTGTLIKAPRTGAEISSLEATTPMDPWPSRPKELAGRGWGPNYPGENDWTKGKAGGWIKGQEWLYAGGSSIVPRSCICISQRLYLDWHKRTFLPEMYRHSVGIIDTAGNVIMHLGKYGNADSGRGKDSPVKVGGDEIALAHVMYVTATDTKLILSDMGNERIICLNLDYHVQETAKIKMGSVKQ